MVECVECICPEVCFDPIPVNGEVLRQAQISVEEVRSAQAVARSDFESDRTDIGGCRSLLVGKNVNPSGCRLCEVRSDSRFGADEDGRGIVREARDEGVGVGSPSLTGVPTGDTADAPSA